MWTLLCALAFAEDPAPVPPPDPVTAGTEAASTGTGAEPSPAPTAWHDQPIDPRANPDGTAFTIPKKHWRLGLVNQEYGLLKNLSIGTVAPLFLLAIPNAHGKVTAVQTPKLDVALQAGWYWSSLDVVGVKNGGITVTPVGWVASWTPWQRLGVHFGTNWLLARADGRLTVDQIGDGIELVTGADLTKDLRSALGGDGGVYAGANVSVLKTHVMVEYRLNRRDSIQVSSDAYVHLSGLVAAGVAVDGKDADVEVGASARLSMPLTKSLASLNAVSWQWSWRKFNLRVGVPVPFDNTFAWLNAVEAYWVLGPTRRKDYGLARK